MAVCLPKACALSSEDPAFEDPDSLELSSFPNMSDQFSVIESLSMSEFKLSAISYISGYVVRMVQKKVQCSKCCKALEAKDIRNLLAPKPVNRKLGGNLVFASEDIVQVCSETELTICKLKSLTNENLPKCKKLSLIVENRVLQKILSREKLFNSLCSRQFDSSGTSNHKILLEKSIAARATSRFGCTI